MELERIDFNPKMKNWAFLGKAFDPDMVETAAANLLSFAQNFNTFVDDKSTGRLELLPCEVALQGDLYGHAGCNDGENVVTPVISHIDKLMPFKMTPTVFESMSSKDYHSIEPVYCATTTSGSKYHFMMDDINDMMAQLLKKAKVSNNPT